MHNFQDKIEYDLIDIQGLIENEVEESIHLDFKEAYALDKSDGKKKDISKDVSSFANSDGGIIVYGVKELNHKAHSISYIDGNIYTKEWLEQTINSSIQRRIQEIKIFPIRNEGNISETIYVVKIPKSFDAPHISRDKKFYKRFNFESVPMEEYEIRQLYGQKIRSKLAIDRWLISRITTNNNELDSYKFKCEVIVFNEGDVVEQTYKVNVYLNNFNEHIKISWPQNHTHYDYTWLEKDRVKVSANGLTPIYPNESVNTVRFDITVPIEKFVDALRDLKIEIALFYPNGEDKMETKLTDLIHKTLNPSFNELESED